MGSRLIPPACTVKMCAICSSTGASALTANEIKNMYLTHCMKRGKFHSEHCKHCIEIEMATY